MGATYGEYRGNGGKLSKNVWARNVLNAAVRRGLIEKTVCVVCYSDQNVQAHHHDYDKPLEVDWLCYKCHLIQEGGVVDDDDDVPF